MSMPGDDDVVIRIRFDIDDAGLERARRKLRAFARDTSELEGRLKKLSGAMDDANDSTVGYSKSTNVASKDSDRFGDSVNRTSKRLRKAADNFDFTGKAASALGKIFSTTLKFGLIGAAIEFAAVGLALSTVNGLLMVGRASVKAYQWTMSGLAYATAAVVTALATVAAAQREYNAAMVSYRYTSAPAFGNGTAQAMSAMRMLTSDAQLASFGMESLNGTFAAVSKNAELTAPMKNALKGVADFAIAAGGDIGKNLTAAGSFIGLLKKEGKVTENVLKAAGEVSTEFQKAVEGASKTGMTGAEELMKGLSSGLLSQAGGVAGSLSAINNTLIGQAKAFFTQTVSTFADLGQFFLPDVKVGFSQLERITNVFFSRISTDVSTFAGGRFIDDLLRLADRLTTLLGDLVSKYLPKSDGMFDGIGRFFTQAEIWFRKFREALNELSAGAKVLTDTFGPPLMAIITGLGGSMQFLADLLVDNEGKWSDFGESVMNIITAIQDAFNQFKNFVTENLPLITGLFNTLAFAIGIVARVLGGLASIADKNQGLGSILGILAIGGTAMGLSRLNQGMGRQGGRLSSAGDTMRNRAFGTGPMAGGMGQSVGTMTVTAGVVNLYGPSQSALAPGARRPGERSFTPGGVAKTYYPAGYPIGAAGGKGPTPPASGGFFSRMGGRLGGFGPNVGASLLSLGLMSQASERAQTGLGIGAMVSMFNPLAGLAVSGGSIAATAETAEGGMFGGALAGAGIGALIAGPLGAAVGGAIGLVAGSIIGAINEGFRREEAIREPIRQQVRERAAGFGRTMIESGPAAARREAERQRRLSGDFENIFASMQVGNGKAYEELLRDAGVEDANSDEGRRRLMEFQMGRLTPGNAGASQRSIDAFRTQFGGTDLKNLPTAVDEFAKSSQEAERTVNAMALNTERNLANLASASGKSEDELKTLAAEMGLDLSSKVYDLGEAFRTLGIKAAETIEELNSAMRDDMLKGASGVLSPIIEREKSLLAVDQATKEVREAGGFSSTLDMAEYLQTMVTGMNTIYPNDPGFAVQELLRQLGPNGVEFGPGGGLEGVTLPPEFQALLAETVRSMAESGIGRTIENTSAFAVENAGGLGLDPASIKTVFDRLMAVDPAQALATADRLNQALTDGGFAERLKNAGSDVERQTMIQEQVTSALQVLPTDIALAVRDARSEDVPTTPEGELTAMAQAVQSGMAGAMSEAGGNMFANSASPTWWTDGSGRVTPSPANVGISQQSIDALSAAIAKATGDTTSSRLASTMTRHGMYDSMLAGNRTVTSAWRNFGLGSLKSDHVTGNAYDLTGQNLVGYATMVNRTGGFAEFHGTGGGRHLHVVPGSPMGDAVAPAPMPVIAAGAGGGSTAYNIQIYAAQGQDPNAIANAVLAKIEARDRDTMERA